MITGTVLGLTMAWRHCCGARDKDEENKGGFKRKARPAQKLFDPDAIKAIGGMPTREKDYWIFENNRYNAKGFLIKNFPLVTVVCILFLFVVVSSNKFIYFLLL